MNLAIGNGAGFLGDSLDAPRRLVESATLDYLTLEYLAELTMSILARSREKDPRAGYANDFLTVLDSLLPQLEVQSQLRIVTNAGGVNPLACAAAAGERLSAARLQETPVGVVRGDDILGELARLQQAGWPFKNFDTGEPLAELREPIVSANAYLGAAGIVEALDGNARIVVTGRVADASLTLGPCVHRFGWRWDDWNTLAAGSVAGHLIECGAQVTGGYLCHPHSLDLADVGYPIAEIDRDGGCVITKPSGSGGLVDRLTVAAQLVYEIGDPQHYLTPDVDCDFTTVELHEQAANRVAVRGATGRQRPSELKVSLAYRAGYQASGQLLVFGKGCRHRAIESANIIQQRLNAAGIVLDRWHVECLGSGDGVPTNASDSSLADDAHASDVPEVMLRITAADRRRDALERFAAEFAPLISAGPPGIAGYAAGRPNVRPMFAYWPTTIPRSEVQPHVEVRTATEWVAMK